MKIVQVESNQQLLNGVLRRVDSFIIEELINGCTQEVHKSVLISKDKNTNTKDSLNQQTSTILPTRIAILLEFNPNLHQKYLQPKKSVQLDRNQKNRRFKISGNQLKPLRNFLKHIELSLQAFYCIERNCRFDRSAIVLPQPQKSPFATQQTSPTSF